MTTIAFVDITDKMRFLGHGGIYTNTKEVNKLVYFLLHNDFLNVICALELKMHEPDFPLTELAEFEKRYALKGYQIDYSLLNKTLQTQLQKTNIAIKKINYIIQNTPVAEPFSKKQKQEILKQSIAIAKICYTNQSAETRKHRIKTLSYNFQNDYILN